MNSQELEYDLVQATSIHSLLGALNYRASAGWKLHSWHIEDFNSCGSTKYFAMLERLKHE